MPNEAMQRLRAKYPQYNSIDDTTLARQIVAKYPQYQEPFADLLQPQQPQSFSGDEYFKQGQPVAGVAKGIRNVLARPGEIIEGIERSGNQILPWLGTATTAIPKGIGAVLGAGGDLLNKGTDLYTKQMFGTTFGDVAGALKNTPLGPAAGELNALREELAPVAVGAGLPAFFKGTKAAVRATGRALPAEHLMQSAGNLGKFTESVEALDAAVNRSLKERIPFGGSYKKLRQNLKDTQGKLQNIVQKQVQPEINRMQAAGEAAPTAEILAKNRRFLLENNSDLKGPQKAKFLEALDKLDESFVKAEGQRLTPKQMQDMKTAIHNKAVYDEAGAFAKEWEKGIAHQARTWLESKSPKLGAVNKRYGELATIRNAQFEQVFGIGDKIPGAISGTPFYMAIAEPVRGAVLSGSRLGFTPGAKSRAARGIQNMREFGKKPQPEQLPQGYTPPQIQGLLPEYQRPIPMGTGQRQLPPFIRPDAPQQTPIWQGGERVFGNRATGGPNQTVPPIELYPSEEAFFKAQTQRRSGQSTGPELPFKPNVQVLSPKSIVERAGAKYIGERSGQVQFNSGNDTFALPAQGLTTDKVTAHIKTMRERGSYPEHTYSQEALGEAENLYRPITAKIILQRQLEELESLRSRPNIDIRRLDKELSLYRRAIADFDKDMAKYANPTKPAKKKPKQ